MSDGHEVPFAVTPETRFVPGGKRARAEDVKVGDRAVVHGERVAGSLEAVEVKLGAASAEKK
jgi:hypothetical protein